MKSVKPLSAYQDNKKKNQIPPSMLHSSDGWITCCGYCNLTASLPAVKIHIQWLHLIGFRLCLAEKFLPGSFDFAINGCWAEGGQQGFSWSECWPVHHKSPNSDRVQAPFTPGQELSGQIWEVGEHDRGIHPVICTDKYGRSFSFQPHSHL